MRSLIFVSHASADFGRVRLVRNYLEEKGTMPLLFHLVSMNRPEQFWPVIEAEIAARNFFLYCDSAAARASEWVRRERDTIDRVASSRFVRIGQIDVSEAEIDHGALDGFIKKTRCYLSYSDHDTSRVQPFIDALKSAGFELDLGPNTTVYDWGYFMDTMARVQAVAKWGWVIFFVSKSSEKNPALVDETTCARVTQADAVVVYLDDVSLSYRPTGQVIAPSDSAGQVQQLLRHLLSS